MRPEVVAHARGEELMPSTIVHSRSILGTFKSGEVNTNLDYFVMGDSMATLVSQVFTIEDSRQKGHVPVQVHFVPQQTSHRAMGIRKPPALLRRRIVGPLQPQGGGQEVAKVMEEAWEGADLDTDKIMQRNKDEVYAACANKAELAIAEATGTSQGRLQSLEPRAVWHSVLPEKVKEPIYPVDGVLHALRGALVQARRVHEKGSYWAGRVYGGCFPQDQRGGSRGGRGVE